MTHAASPLGHRRAGMLLHPTSLPGPGVQGDIGREAHRFVDFLVQCGISVWQTLPLGPTHGDGSPYQSLSVHAGNPALVSLDWLVDKGWLVAAELPAGPRSAVQLNACLGRALTGLQARGSEADREAFARFKDEQAHWLEDYVLYRALRAHHAHRAWCDWPASLRDREPRALAEARGALAAELEQIRFKQFVFFEQWRELREYARARDVLLFGDMPIFVAHDSAEVWAHREYFQLDAQGQPRVVAGVPPDYFSATGQRWGNPHYDWARMQADGFDWWIRRMGSQLELFDWVRIDHFRGFEAYWEVPAEATTAIEGRWVQARGEALLGALHDAFSALPVIAEDLGIITPEVVALREQFNLPGMTVLHFAFSGGPDNPYLPHNHQENGVVYTGTHDNDTTLGWYAGLAPAERAHLHEYLGPSDEAMPWPLIRVALASVARLAILPLQDALALGSEHRMNTPGTSEGNWRWRFSWEQVPSDLTARLARLCDLYGRRRSEQPRNQTSD